MMDDISVDLALFVPCRQEFFLEGMFLLEFKFALLKFG